MAFPDVPEALTGARRRERARALAHDALITALRGYVDDRRELPVPSGGAQIVHLSPLEAAKLGLYSAMRERGLSNVALGKQLGMAEGAVRRMLDLDHNSKIETIAEALERVFHYRMVSTMVAA